MGDYKFSQIGFKYPERIYGQKYQYNPADKPALLKQVTKSANQMDSSINLLKVAA